MPSLSSFVIRETASACASHEARQPPDGVLTDLATPASVDSQRLSVPAPQRGTQPAALQRQVFRSEAARIGHPFIAAPADAPLERRKPRHGAGAP